jgi:flagellar motor protein MotB
MAVRKSMALVWLLGVLGGGCSTMSEGLRGLGFESRASRLYRKQKADNARLAAQNAESEARLASMMAEQDRLAAENARLAKLAKATNVGPAAPIDTAPDNNDAKWARLLQRLGSDAELVVTPDGNKGVRVTGDLFFRSGKTSVRSEARGVLRKIATAINEFGNVAVFVDGHTDNDPLRYTKAKYGDNYGLGAARAAAVAKELVALGVPRNRLITRSFGEKRPIAENTTRAGKSKNRRVEFMFAFTKTDPAMKMSLDR